MTQLKRLQTILVPVDFSECSTRALGLAHSLASQLGAAHVILIHVCLAPPDLERLVGRTHDPLLDVLSERAIDDLERLLLGLQDDGISAEFEVQRGLPEAVVVDVAAKKEADLIIMGMHGRSGLSQVFLGSVAERVVRTAPCPVMTVK
jgi:nucleotide-binding universal stress UspA family protein